MDKIEIAITAGDPAGIGYEIACKYLVYEDTSDYNITIVGYKDRVIDTFDNILKYNLPNGINILEPETKIDLSNITYGKASSYTGKAAYECIATAVDGCLAKKFDTIVTCPINKKALQIANIGFTGHTEILADLTGVNNVSMLLVGNNIKTIIATNHTPIANVASFLTVDIVYNAIKNAHNAGKYFGKPNPTIAVCGLNPHAGDDGAIGTEEQTIIAPAINKAIQNGINVSGAYPADTIFLKSNKYDIIIAMLHDQGMLAVKMDSFGEAVNVTLNLPFIRTSVDHGTAFDIAGKGIASYSSLQKAIKLANEMTQHDKSFRRIQE